MFIVVATILLAFLAYFIDFRKWYHGLKMPGPVFMFKIEFLLFTYLIWYQMPLPFIGNGLMLMNKTAAGKVCFIFKLLWNKSLMPNFTRKFNSRRRFGALLWWYRCSVVSIRFSRFDDWSECSRSEWFSVNNLLWFHVIIDLVCLIFQSQMCIINGTNTKIIHN